jgi:predicted anti-sigma-YlaC factor YlaD
MTCRDWQHLLQAHLDGTTDAGLEDHLRACPDCATQRQAIRRLLDGLALLASPAPPAGLSEHLTARLIAEDRTRRRQRLHRRLVPVLSLAAAALLVVVLGRIFWPGPTAPVDPRPVVRLPDPPAEPLRDSVAQASTAVATLTARTASATVDQTATLLPLVQGAALEPLAVAPTPLDPPIQPLREATEGVSAGLAPVADSARRAVNLFFRDLPMGRTEDERMKEEG